jgi:hypothetical protein
MVPTEANLEALDQFLDKLLEVKEKSALEPGGTSYQFFQPPQEKDQDGATNEKAVGLKMICDFSIFQI